MLNSEKVYDEFSKICDQALINGSVEFKGYGDSLPADMYPSVYLSVGRESAQPFSMSQNQHELEIILKISVQNDKDLLDKSLYSERLEIHKLIFKNKNLGLPCVQSVSFSSQSPTEYSGDGDSYRASTDITYLVTFLSKFNE